MNPSELSEQEVLRRGSLDTLRQMGIEPYPAAEFPVSGHSVEIKENFNDEDAPRQVSVAGRILGLSLIHL